MNQVPQFALGRFVPFQWIILFVLQGCMSNVARTNARIEHGFDVAVSGVMATLPEGTGSDTNATGQERQYFMPEIDFQYGWASSSERFGYALQLKLEHDSPAVDFYVQAPSSHPNFFGMGFELGPFSSLYLVYTRYLYEGLYVSLTPRAHMYPFDLKLDRDQKSFGLSPQVSLGLSPPDVFFDLSFFVQYVYLFGQGIDYHHCVFGDCEEETDFRKKALLIGASVRF